MVTDIPEFGEAREFWFVFGKGDVKYANLDKLEPRSFKLRFMWILRNATSQFEPGWILESLTSLLSDYIDANKWITQRTYRGVNTEQEAWSNYMRHVEHEMAVVRDNTNARLRTMEAISIRARSEWIRTQKETPVAGLMPPEPHERDFTVR